MSFLVIHNEKTGEFEPYIWTENVTHTEYIAKLAGIKKDILYLPKEEKQPFYDMMKKVSSLGIIKSSPSRGWYLDQPEVSSNYKHRLEDDTRIVLIAVENRFGCGYTFNANLMQTRGGGADKINLNVLKLLSCLFPITA